MSFSKLCFSLLLCAVLFFTTCEITVAGTGVTARGSRAEVVSTHSDFLHRSRRMLVRWASDPVAVCTSHLG